MVNYTVNPIPKEVNSGEIWGDQDVDNVLGSDNGETPLQMTINANEGYTVTASSFNIKGCSPTYTFTGTNGVETREWSNGEQTTYTAPDGTTSTVTIGEGNFVMPNINKVWMYDSSVITSTEVLWPTSGYTTSDLNNGTFVYQTVVESGIQLGTTLPASGFPNANGGFSNVLLGGTLVQAGDVFGAFYEQDGNYICAGIQQFTNVNLNPSSLFMEIFGDMSQSPAVPLVFPNTNPGFGFTYGQEIYFFILQQSTGNTYKIEFESWHPSFNNPSTAGFQNGESYKPIAGYSADLTLEDSTTVSLYEQTPSTGDANFINVKAWVDYNYTIGIEDTQLYLDIDGDAVSIEPSQLESEFYITLKLKNGENSNAIIEANTGFYGESIIGGNAPSWFVESINVDDHTAKLLFTKNPSYTTPINLGFYGFSAFVIKPKNSSYTVCKDNFWVETIGDYTTNTYGYGGPNLYEGSNPDLPGNSTIAWWRADITGNVYVNRYGGSTTNMTGAEYWLGYQYGSYGSETEYDGPNEGFAKDKVKNYKLGLEDGDNVEYINSNDILSGNGINLNYSLILANSFLYMTQSDILNQNEYGDILSSNVPWTWDENYPIRTSGVLNPIDWVSNVVRITVADLFSYIPEANLQTGTNIPKNFVIEIEGSAMEISSDMPTVLINGVISEDIK